jgi:hypothetical protein
MAPNADGYIWYWQQKIMKTMLNTFNSEGVKLDLRDVRVFHASEGRKDI